MQDNLNDEDNINDEEVIKKTTIEDHEGVFFGEIQKLIVQRETDSGYYLALDEDGYEVFLPGSAAPISIEIAAELEVFVYKDTIGRPMASVELPTAEVGQFAYLEVVEVTEFGAFLNWGIDKDLLIPANQQKYNLAYGEFVLVYVELDEYERVYATSKVGNYLETENIKLKEKQKVKLVPYQRTDLGFKVLIDVMYTGMIYHSEIFSIIKMGEEIDGNVKIVRADGLIDCSLQASGMRNLKDGAKTILIVLENAGGSIGIHDKSAPDVIMRVFGMSKQAFKKSVGILYREKKILISKEGLSLIKKDEPKLELESNKESETKED
jgi:predicted RNA-binding protein (virulence factor B family)